MTFNYLRPPVADVYGMLRADNSLIVHFSGLARGAGNSLKRRYYPDDLQNVVRSGAMGGVSCSVIHPGDTIGTPGDNNATGCIGVVLGFNRPTSLLDAHAKDCGSSALPDGSRVPNPRPFCLADVEATLTGRQLHHYNEWVVGDYRVLGIFVAPPLAVQVVQPINAPTDVSAEMLGDVNPLGPRYETIPDVQRDFPKERIFAFKNSAIVEHAGGQWTIAPHETIYF
jgi:hypothetical protein